MEKQNRQPELTLLFTVLLTGIGGRAGGNGPPDLLIGFGCAWSTLLLARCRSQQPYIRSSDATVMKGKSPLELQLPSTDNNKNPVE
jgi:hypothetical protein